LRTFDQMKKLTPLISFLLYGNFFVACCAVAMVTQTYLLRHQDLNKVYLLFVFFSTLFLYNLQRIVLSPVYIKAPGSERHAWIVHHRKTLLLLSAISALGALVCMPFLETQLLFTMILPGIISVLYFLPGIGLRKIPALKALAVALVWAFTGVLVPLLLTGTNPISRNILYMFTERTLFLLSICIVFNIRDIEHDRLSRVRTISSLYGARTGVLAGLSAIIASAFFSFLLYRLNSYSKSDLFAILTSLLLTSLLICNVRSATTGKKNSEFFYLIGMDGMILVQLFLLCAFDFF
jgi:4-hydroxybenzoate polyprenyltransferase